MPSFSSHLEESLHRALEYANERSHEYATLEHLLLSLIDDRDAAAVMRACNVDLDLLRGKQIDYLDNDLDNLVIYQQAEAQPTAGFQRVIHRAVVHVQSSGREEVTGANVLVAIFAERESHAAYFLQEQEMTRFDAVNYISHGIAKRPGMSEPRVVRGVDEDAATVESGDEKKRAGDILSVYAAMGFILLLFRKVSDKGLLKWSLALLAVPIVTYVLLYILFVAFAPPEVAPAPITV